MHNQRSIYGSMIQEHAVNRMRALNEARTKRIDALSNREEAVKYVEDIRAKVQSCFPMPADRSVPETELCGVVEKEGFRVEKIIYFSRPSFPVTANLYLPDTPGKHPGVLFLCGHSGDGKACETYQRAAQNLVLQGYVVLLVDPVSQGERKQFLDVPNAKHIQGCTSEHTMMGKQLRLCGEFLGAWRAYDALRGLDYLLSRSEVDPERIGITGNSGGGTMTAFVQALDSRFTMAAPSCYITSWQRNFENELVADAEQMVPGILGKGCEMGDLILAYAPRPVLLLGQKNDFFDARGLKETFENARKVYKLLGAEENLQFFIGPTDHGYSVENREAMYQFFGTHAGRSAAGESEAVKVLAPQETFCTASGQLLTSRSELATLHKLLERSLLEMAESRKKLSAAELKEAMAELLGLPREIPLPYCRHLPPISCPSITPERSVFSRFGIEPEPGVFGTLKINAPQAYRHFPALEKMTLYLPHLDAGSEVLKYDRDPEEIMAGFDFRNMGESLAQTGSFGSEYRKFCTVFNQDYHYDGIELMFGSSMAARRVLDVLSAVEYAKSAGVQHLHLIARGQGVVPGILAALLSEKIESVTLHDAPVSWISMVQKRVTAWPQSCMVPGVLKITDLPEIYETVGKEKDLNIVNFVNEPIPEV
ncbi:MAG: prolyl oligopeptidase family serine peptidase [Lentisphaeria bacterium]|nr:prolyl oligopeptidase family serine peptidase [Lentisphaeria bacterium]